jgi:biuret amidohydrolase
VQQSGCLKEGSRLAAIVEPLAPEPGDVVITHQRLGGFEGSALDDVLKNNGITTLIFAGVATYFSVEGTARTASDLGYRTLVVEDACSASTTESHAASIESLRLLAEITTLDEVTQALSVSSTHHV